MIVLVLAILILMTAVMLAAWFTQRAVNNGGWTDVFWTYGTGVTCAVAALVPGGLPPAPYWRHVLVAAMVAVWAGRLGTYVARRVATSKEDARYAAMREEAGAGFQRQMFRLLIVQGPVTALLSVAILFAARQPAPSFRVLDLLGVAIMFAAIAGEGLADGQMKRFKRDSANHDKVCDAGLWAWSRHPNYLFELLGWFAYPVIGVTAANAWSLLSFMAPVLMFLVLRYATGVPPLEAAMLRSKGDAYRRYQARVPGAILPRL